MEEEDSEVRFVREVLGQMDFEELIDQFLVDPLRAKRIDVSDEYAERVAQFKEQYQRLHGEMLRIKIRGMNPSHEFDATSRSNTSFAAVATPPLQLPITLENSKSAAVFSAQSSFTRFVDRINQPLHSSPPSCALLQSSARIPQATPTVPARYDPSLDFENYTIPQLKLAMQQLGQKYKGQRAAVDYLIAQRKAKSKLPTIALTAYQIMTPQRKNDLQFRLQKAIQESKFYQSIISFVPVDIQRLFDTVKRHNVRISYQFFEEYLIGMGVQFCHGERKIGEMSDKKSADGPRQLTLSENLRQRQD